MCFFIPAYHHRGGIPLLHLGFQTSLSIKKKEMFLWLTDIKLYKKGVNNFYIHRHVLTAELGYTCHKHSNGTLAKNRVDFPEQITCEEKE